MGIQITEETEIAENLNYYFCIVFSKEESILEPDITTSSEVMDILIKEDSVAKVIQPKNQTTITLDY